MSSTWIWPGHARAAISLTYDDGNENNLDQAMPDLEAHGYRGTFYLTIARPDMQRRVADWRRAFERGHEIGNHTTNHVCRAEPYIKSGKPVPAWLGRSLEQYTPAMIADDVTGAANWLTEQIGPDAERSFCYPCGAVAIGDPADEASYDAAIARHHWAARTTGRQVNQPETVQFLRVAAFGCSGSNPAPFIGHCEQAVANGGWTVLYFHGVGGPSHQTDRSVHQAILAHLRAGPFWVAPFKTVASYIRQHR